MYVRIISITAYIWYDIYNPISKSYINVKFAQFRFVTNIGITL